MTELNEQNEWYFTHTPMSGQETIDLVKKHTEILIKEKVNQGHITAQMGESIRSNAWDYKEYCDT